MPLSIRTVNLMMHHIPQSGCIPEVYTLLTDSCNLCLGIQIFLECKLAWIITSPMAGKFEAILFTLSSTSSSLIAVNERHPRVYVRILRSKQKCNIGTLTVALSLLTFIGLLAFLYDDQSAKCFLQHDRTEESSNSVTWFSSLLEGYLEGRNWNQLLFTTESECE